MKFTPRSMARCSAAKELLSSVLPQASPPIPQAPKLIAEIFQPVRPNARYSIYSASPSFSLLSSRMCPAHRIFAPFKEQRTITQPQEVLCEQMTAPISQTHANHFALLVYSRQRLDSKGA